MDGTRDGDANGPGLSSYQFYDLEPDIEVCGRTWQDGKRIVIIIAHLYGEVVNDV